MRVDALVNLAATYLAMGDVARAEQAMAEVAADKGTAINPASPTGISIQTEPLIPTFGSTFAPNVRRMNGRSQLIRDQQSFQIVR